MAILKLRIPKRIHTYVTTTAPISLSLFMRQALDCALADKTLLVKAFEARFGSTKEEEVTTTFAAPFRYRQTLKELAEYTHLSENQVCVLALEAALQRLGS